MDVVHIGLVGTFFVCRTVVPHMIAQNYGRIVNLASVAGKEGNPGRPGLFVDQGRRHRADQVARQGTGEIRYRASTP